MALAREAQTARQFTDVSKFALRCLVCQCGLVGCAFPFEPLRGGFATDLSRVVLPRQAQDKKIGRTLNEGCWDRLQARGCIEARDRGVFLRHTTHTHTRMQASKRSFFFERSHVSNVWGGIKTGLGPDTETHRGFFVICAWQTGHQNFSEY